MDKLFEDVYCMHLTLSKNNKKYFHYSKEKDLYKNKSKPIKIKCYSVLKPNKNFMKDIPCISRRIFHCCMSKKS